MADRAISELKAVLTVNNTDLFVLQQDNEARKLTGQVLLNWLAIALDGHGGINDIKKTDTSVLVDTYTITFADETTRTFTVTNGKGVESIKKTKTNVLIDTYTIAYNDGSSDTFTVTNGRGISGISKTKSEVLVDTYTVKFNDNTSTTFTVTNGKGISKIEKTNTSGLVDTYTISYNDNTSSTFTVTNGEKGDKGDNTYTWIKYSEGKPTQDADMKDEPNNYMGVYFGSANSAPTTYTSYLWFKIKGEKGDTGDDVRIIQTSVQYVQAESGTVTPSDGWQNTIPEIIPGRYLWTKTFIKFSTGEEITSYSVSRYGLDGTGSVNTVNGIAPDENHNIALPTDAPEYDSTSDYAVNDYCVHENLLYRCKTPITGGETWDETHWELTTVTDELRRIMTATWGEVESWG